MNITYIRYIYDQKICCFKCNIWDRINDPKLYYIVLCSIFFASLQYTTSLYASREVVQHSGPAHPVQSESIWQVATQFISRGPLGTCAVWPFTVCLLTALRPGCGSAVRSTRGISGWQTTGWEPAVSASDSGRNRYNISLSLPLTVYSIWQSLSATVHLTQRFTVHRSGEEACEAL